MSSRQLGTKTKTKAGKGKGRLKTDPPTHRAMKVEHGEIATVAMSGLQEDGSAPNPEPPSAANNGSDTATKQEDGLVDPHYDAVGKMFRLVEVDESEGFEYLTAGRLKDKSKDDKALDIITSQGYSMVDVDKSTVFRCRACCSIMGPKGLPRHLATCTALNLFHNALMDPFRCYMTKFGKFYNHLKGKTDKQITDYNKRPRVHQTLQFLDLREYKHLPGQYAHQLKDPVFLKEDGTPCDAPPCKSGGGDGASSDDDGGFGMLDIDIEQKPSIISRSTDSSSSPGTRSSTSATSPESGPIGGAAASTTVKQAYAGRGVAKKTQRTSPRLGSKSPEGMPPSDRKQPPRYDIARADGRDNASPEITSDVDDDDEEDSASSEKVSDDEEHVTSPEKVGDAEVDENQGGDEAADAGEHRQVKEKTTSVKEDPTDDSMVASCPVGVHPSEWILENGEYRCPRYIGDYYWDPKTGKLDDERIKEADHDYTRNDLPPHRKPNLVPKQVWDYNTGDIRRMNRVVFVSRDEECPEPTDPRCPVDYHADWNPPYAAPLWVLAEYWDGRLGGIKRSEIKEKEAPYAIPWYIRPVKRWDFNTGDVARVERVYYFRKELGGESREGDSSTPSSTKRKKEQGEFNHLRGDSSQKATAYNSTCALFVLDPEEPAKKDFKRKKTRPTVKTEPQQPARKPNTRQRRKATK